MKKIIVLLSLTTILSSLSSFGQGYLQFTTAKSQVWDSFSTGSPQLATTIDVAFLWAPAGNVPLVNSILTSTPTSGLLTFTPSMAWNDIMADPNFRLGMDNATGQIAVSQSTSRGAINYNSGTAFGVSGTSANTTYEMFLIGWDNRGGTLTTPTLAASAGAWVGWSAPFSYTTTVITVTPNSMIGQIPPFGVLGVPEPASMVLAGLGGLSLLLFRRRK